MMTGNFFSTLLNMSITASVAAAAVIAIRFILGKWIPKWITYALWSVVLLRLFIPFSIPAVFSIFSALPAAQESQAADGPAAVTQIGYGIFDNTGSAVEPIPVGAGADPAGTIDQAAPASFDFAGMAFYIWLVGFIVMTAVFIFLMLNMCKRLSTSIRLGDDQALSDATRSVGLQNKTRLYKAPYFDTPVVSGIFRPRIILPDDFDPNAKENEFIYIHELIHIKRRDNLIKMLAFAALSLHWFNPLVWVSYFLCIRDMESSCDEKVLKISAGDTRSSYSMSLLRMAANQTRVPLTASILAFGESDVKRRVKQIMSFKKARILTVIVAVTVSLLAGCSLLSNPAGGQTAPAAESISNRANAVQMGIMAKQDNWVYFSSLIDNRQLFKVRTDGKSMKKLYSGNVSFINVSGQWVYFIDVKDGSGLISRIKTDGSGYSNLSSDNAECLYLSEGKLYYIEFDSKLTYSISTEGGDKTLFNGEPSEQFYIDGSTIYYVSADGTKNIYRIGTDGTGKTKLTDGESANPVAAGGYVYYIDLSDGYKLSMVSEAGGPETAVTDDMVYGMYNIRDDYLYYVCTDDAQKSMYLTKIRTDGTDRTELYSWCYGTVCILGDRIYFAPGNIRSMKFDGSDIRIVEPVDNSRVYLSTPVAALNPNDDVRGLTLGMTKDISGLDLSGRGDILFRVTFNSKTLWPEASKMPAGLTPAEMIEQAKDPGLGIRALNKKGITGKGISIGIISQPAYLDNPEYKSRIKEYKDFDSGTVSSFSGSATISLVAGRTTGVAPGANIYYAAVPSWLQDYEYFARALDWFIQKNESLPQKDRIRVVLADGVYNNAGSKNLSIWNGMYKKASEAGIIVLDATASHAFTNPCKLDFNDPDNIDKASVLKSYGKSRIAVPAFSRTMAEEELPGDYRFVFAPGGSLELDYLTGVLALGFQTDPSISSQDMMRILFDSAYELNGNLILDPANLIEMIKAN